MPSGGTREPADYELDSFWYGRGPYGLWVRLTGSLRPRKKLAKELRKWRDQEPRSSGLQPVLNAPMNFSVWFQGGIKTSFLLALDT